MNITSLRHQFFKTVLILLINQLILAQNQVANTENNTPSLPSQTVQTSDHQLVEEVIIVYKTHFDLGYSALARDVIHGYRTKMLEDVLSAVELNRTRPKSEQFVWTLAGWPMEQMLWDGQEPKRKAALEKALREGNLAIHALPFTTHTETLGPEELVRGLGFSSGISRRYGLPLSRSGKMTDVPSHSWILPTLLSHANIKFFQIGGGMVNKGPEIPMLFWWEGPDGSRLLTLYINAYGTPRLPTENWPAKTWLYLSMTGDNAGPPDPQTVKEDIEYFHKNLPGVKIKIGKLDDFSDRIIAQNPELPVVRGDMPDTWVHGVMSAPEGTKLARKIRSRIAATEILHTLEQTWGIYVPDIKPTIADAYEQSLLYGEHTWGLAAQHYRVIPYGEDWEQMLGRGLPPNFKALEESWDEHENYIRTADNLIKTPLANLVANLADHVKQDGRRIVVYNPLPWERDGMVTVNVCYWGGHFTGVKAVDGDDIVPLIHEGRSAEKNQYNLIRFMAKNIPSMGYRTYILMEDRGVQSDGLIVDEKSGIIENKWFRVQFNKREGRIESIIDKNSGTELVDSGSKYGFGQYLYERFGKTDVLEYTNTYLFAEYPMHKNVFDKRDVPEQAVYQSVTCSNMNLTTNKNAVEVSAVMAGGFDGPGMPQSASITLILYKDKPVIDLEISIDKKPDEWPEAGWVCLPFNVKNFTFRLGRNGSIINPNEDIIDGCNFRQLWTYSGAAVFNEKRGIGICPMDSPLLSLGEPGGRKYENRYEPNNASFFINLYNNQFATNFREWWGGKLTSRIRIWTFDKYDNESSLYTPAMEAREPLMVARSDMKNGKLPTERAGLLLSRKGIKVTAFGPNPDGEGTVLRLWEQAGISGRCDVQLPMGIKAGSIQPVDLRGTPEGVSISVTNGSFSVEIREYAPASYVIQ